MFNFTWLALLLPVAVLADPVPHGNWSFDDIANIPVQHGGRIKPLDTFAREAVLYETGSRSFEGWKPVDLVLSWISAPRAWEQKPFIKLGRVDLKRQLGLDPERARFSPAELLANPKLGMRAEQLAKAQTAKLSAADAAANDLLDRLRLFTAVASGRALALVPRPAPEAWLSLSDQNPGVSELETTKMLFTRILQAHLSADETSFGNASLALRHFLESADADAPSNLRAKLKAEVFYNRARLFLWAWIAYLLAAASWFMPGFMAARDSRQTKTWSRVASAISGLAIALHAAGMGLRCFIAGRPPVTNMYESVVWVSFGVMLFGVILFLRQRQRAVMAIASVLSSLTLMAGDGASAVLDASIRPLVPVLRSNYWLTIHVLTITLGYAAFALTLGLANVTLFYFSKGDPTKKPLIATLNQLTYHAMQFGVVLLAAGTILGGIWADYSWGRFWGWDPKEVWALIALLSYLVILHARFTGWIGQFGYAALTVLSFLSVVMAWYGVNFVLGVGLHTYGFSTGGRGYVFAFVASQVAYVSLTAVLTRLRPR